MLLAALLLAAAPTAVVQAPICADRPAKGNAVCTVPAGSFQVETGLADWTLAKQSGTRSEFVSLGSTVLKYGLSDRSDVELGITPYARASVRDGAGRSHAAGVGDVVVRFKHQLTGSSAKLQAALLPFVKIPTAASGLGNGQVEAGLAVPMSFALIGPATMTLGPELDWLADGDGHGRHLALVNLANLSLPIAPRVTAAAELWSNFNFDPAATLNQASADAALAYAVSNDAQLDAGANFGLTRDTPDVELYAGASLRF